MIDISKIVGAAIEAGEDQTVVKTGDGGGDYTPPAAGACGLRLISYIEIGQQKNTYQGAEKVEDQVVLGFELSGPNHPPRVTESGEQIPIRMDIVVKKSLHEKASFRILFDRMNHKGTAKHMAQLLGQAFKGEVVHTKSKDGKRTYADLYKKGSGYTVAPAVVEIIDPDTGIGTGKFREVKVAPAITPLKLFLWNNPDASQWASIFIDGEYPERKDKDGVVIAPPKSKNRFQNAIRAALNFQGSPVHAMLLGGDLASNLPTVEDTQVIEPIEQEDTAVDVTDGVTQPVTDETTDLSDAAAELAALKAKLAAAEAAAAKPAAKPAVKKKGGGSIDKLNGIV